MSSLCWAVPSWEQGQSLHFIGTNQGRSLTWAGTQLPAVSRKWLVLPCSRTVHWSV